MTKIAWIGLGLMGKPMAKHMQDAGYEVVGFDIDRQACEQSRTLGLTVADSLAGAVKDAEVVFTMVPTGSDVKDVLLGSKGVFAQAPKGVLAIDCSTIGVDNAHEIHAAARKVGAEFMEAPVSGGTEGARDGNLTFMIGGDKKNSARVSELLQPIGDYIAYVGGDGAGQAAKIVNNLIMGVCVTVNCEATDLANRLGLDLKALYEIVLRSSGNNWAFKLWNPGEGVVPESPASNGYKPGFKTWLLAKDLSLALEVARAAGSNVATAEAAYALLNTHIKDGGKDMDCTSLVLSLAKQGHTTHRKAS
ncbi:3-hydroxyisobutyrate dehydrogenase [Agrobacterium tumefaciens]|uniref:3-hydroxyisobutyrate dehydrogenase n=1 Tax=Agrobacterium tumefaciens TaxID=358 RepID=UPI0015724E66|nr:3-hydroxyisobutyrate dehydrogenase [Agrobacterium tumefaciens]NTB97397.1 3-hydroxyisobutyrate dehydrogenase [Agrobacterium tumefaciens]NTC45364.1 3-hydroxyisobutyrate dehydrogenase [Agrobacterium tumefaciens]